MINFLLVIFILLGFTFSNKKCNSKLQKVYKIEKKMYVYTHLEYTYFYYTKPLHLEYILIQIYTLLLFTHHKYFH